MAVLRPVNRSHSYSYAPSFHDETRLMTMDFGFNICYETPSKARLFEKVRARLREYPRGYLRLLRLRVEVLIFMLSVSITVTPSRPLITGTVTESPSCTRR